MARRLPKIPSVSPKVINWVWWGLMLGVIAVVAYVTFTFVTMYLESSRVLPSSQEQSQVQSRTPPPNVVIVNKTEAPDNNPFVYESEGNLRNPPAKPFYYPTRGLPQAYKQQGVLIGTQTGAQGEQTIIPLIGRQTHPGSNRYHYYTTTNGFHPMKLPLTHNNRPCNDSTGCDEIYSGNIVSVPGYDYDFKADIYPSPDLQYIL